MLRVAVTATRLLGGLFNRPAAAAPLYRLAPLQRLQSQKLKRTAASVQAINWNWPITANREHSITTSLASREFHSVYPILDAFRTSQAPVSLSAIRTQKKNTDSFQVDLSRPNQTQSIIGALHSRKITAKKRDTTLPLVPMTKISQDLPAYPVAPLASSNGEISPGKTAVRRVQPLPVNFLSVVGNADLALSTPDEASSLNNNFATSKDLLPPSELANDTRQRASHRDEANSKGLKSDTGTIILDGAALAQWMINYLEAVLTRPQSGMTGVDPRAAQPMSRLTPF